MLVRGKPIWVVEQHGNKTLQTTMIVNTTRQEDNRVRTLTNIGVVYAGQAWQQGLPQVVSESDVQHVDLLEVRRRVPYDTQHDTTQVSLISTQHNDHKMCPNCHHIKFCISEDSG